MKITFPHMGDAHLIGKLFFREIGIDIVTPSLNVDKSLELGSAVAPDEICLPFKLMIANLICAYEMGADTVIMPATIGPCRLGEYGELLKSILDKKGYNLKWILIDTPKAIGKRELLRRLASTVSERNCKMTDVVVALNKTYQVIKQFERLETRGRILCGYEEVQGSCQQIVKECRMELNGAVSLAEARPIIKEYDQKLRKLKVDRSRKPLKILLVGEFYSSIEPFANHRIEEVLMGLGVSFRKPVTLGWWIKNNMEIHLPLPWKTQKKNKYMPYSIGGYSKETIEEALNSKKKHYDGIIQIFPVGCMPEIVAKSVLGQMAREEGIKVMTVIFDEMGGEAGYLTRIEAFVDMLNFIKGKAGDKNVLYRN